MPLASQRAHEAPARARPRATLVIRFCLERSLLEVRVSRLDACALVAVTLSSCCALSQLGQLIDLAGAPVFGIDGDGNVSEWNRKMFELTGFDKEEVLGKDFVRTFVSVRARNAAL